MHKQNHDISYIKEYAAMHLASLLTSLQRPVELNSENLITFILHLSLANCTNHYCKHLATSVVNHPSYVSQKENVLRDKNVIAAIANAGHQSPLEDNQIPISFDMIKNSMTVICLPMMPF